MKSEKLTINGKSYTVDPFLTDYAVMPRASSYIAFIAVNSEEKKLFIQFNNGHCTVFKEVPAETLNSAKNAPSIGKFFHASIKDKFSTEDVGENLITDWKEDEDDDIREGTIVRDDEHDW